MTSKLLELDVKRMTFLAGKWGCVPRTLLQLIRRKQSDSMTEGWYRKRARLGVLRSTEMVDGIAQNALFDDAPSQIFFCRPLIESNNINRQVPCATVPTPTIRRLLGEALQHYPNMVKLEFFNALRQSSDTSQAAGIIFENWFHGFFCGARNIKCNWVQGKGTSELSGATSLVPSPLTSVKTARPPYYWVAPRNFKGIDSALVLAEEIYAFQVTIGTSHGPPMAGMETLRGYLPADLKKNPWRVVFVGDDDDRISRVAKEFKMFFPTARKHVPIAWVKVDPVSEGISYKVCKVG